ncbi:MAG: SDR family oxidoreductase [Rubrivivax sp.]|nr:SDR family oxidoreductase [Rubrivivax sp.]
MSAAPLQGRTVLVTGGTRGIGRAISLQLARAGARVLANHARNESAAAALGAAAAAEGLELSTLRADLTSAKGMESIREAVAATTALSLVHAAATGVHKPSESLTLRHWDFTHALNVRAFFELVQLLRPHFGPGSAIVPISSAGAVRAVPAYAAIGSSKAALEALARHLAAELAPAGVRVNIVAPGSVLTEAWDAFPDKAARIAAAAARTPRGHLVRPEEVASLVQFLLSPASEGIVGQTLVIDGGAQIVE